jgi:hypothetical protein
MSPSDTFCHSTQNVRNEPTAAELELSPRQLAALNLLFAGASFAQTARQLKLSKRTLYRWKRDPIFVAEIHRRYRDSARSAPQGVRTEEGGRVPSNMDLRAAAKPRSPEPIWERAARMSLEELDRELARRTRTIR